MHQNYLLEFDGITCPGCVKSIEQKIESLNPQVTLAQWEDMTKTLIIQVTIDSTFISKVFHQVQGCCATCVITLAAMQELSSTSEVNKRVRQKDANKNADHYNVLKAQYAKSIQAIHEGTEVACSEHCVCKETEVDRLAEFPAAPSLGSIHDLVTRVSHSFKHGDNVVDFGCGTGHNTLKIAPLIAPGTVTGIDLTPEMIQHARHAAQQLDVDNAQFIEASSLKDIPPNSQDVIIMNNVFNMLTPEDRGIILQQAARCLKSQGYLIIADEFSRAPLPETLQNDPQLQCGGIAGAQTMDSFVALVESLDFKLKEHEKVKEYTIQHGTKKFHLFSAHLTFQKLPKSVK